MTLFYVVFAIAAIVGLGYIFIGNNLIAKKNRVKQCESGICIALKQRNDLIPNLVATVKAYIGYENETLIQITELRAHAEQSAEPEEQIKTGNRLSAILPKLNVSVEAYPDLKADTQFIKLQENIEETELNLQAIRRTYNAAAIEFNNYIEMFPSCLVARQRKYQPVPLFEIAENEKTVVDIQELFK